MAFAQDRKFRLRVYYRKIDRAVYLSHLETIRAIDKAIRRAGLPYVVTQGFSPHMKISFGAALSLGIESKSEVFDIYLNEYIDDKTALSRLQNASIDDLCPYKCEYVDNDEPALGSVFEDSKYIVVLNDKIDNLDIPQSFVIRRKKKDRQVNIKDYLISDVKIDNTSGYSKLCFSLASSSSGSLNPELFIKQVLKNSKLENCKIVYIQKI